MGRANRRDAVGATSSKGGDDGGDAGGRDDQEARERAVHPPSGGTNESGTFTSTHPPLGGGNLADRNIPITQFATSVEWTASCEMPVLHTFPCGSIRKF